jgi:purine-cytosine permease-like protein
MSPDTSQTHEASAVRWPSRVGAWLGIGTSPAALALGAGLAERHGGAVGVLGVALGMVLMALMLYGQGLIGVVPPVGDGGTLSAVAPRYLAVRTVSALHVLMALAMVGWFGFNVGLGGAALSAVTGVPAAVGPLLLGVSVMAAAAAGLRIWNALAVVTTLCALALVGFVVARFAPAVPPVSSDVGGAGTWLADAGAFVGYVAVFGLRAPDFSHGLARRSDLRWCVGLLVVATGLVAVAGAALFLGTGTADVVGAITRGRGAALGNTLITVAVIAATFTTLYSASLALRAVLPIRSGTAMLAIAVPGLVLAVLRFDRLLLPWLSVLAVVLPPLLVPMALEAARRRRRLPPRAVTLATWVPAALVGVVLVMRGVGYAALVGLVVAAASTAVTHLFARRSPSSD